jgi:hypothetical protein
MTPMSLEELKEMQKELAGSTKKEAVKLLAEDESLKDIDDLRRMYCMQ